MYDLNMSTETVMIQVEDGSVVELPTEISRAQLGVSALVVGIFAGWLYATIGCNKKLGVERSKASELGSRASKAEAERDEAWKVIGQNAVASRRGK